MSISKRFIGHITLYFQGERGNFIAKILNFLLSRRDEQFFIPYYSSQISHEASKPPHFPVAKELATGMDHNRPLLIRPCYMGALLWMVSTADRRYMEVVP